jgi:D-alanyl-D-alanine dipeptidase
MKKIYSPLAKILLRPIPDQATALVRKQGYRDYPLYQHKAHAKDAFVDIADYGIAGQSYYSRPNPATGDPVPGVEPTIIVREQLAQLLASINYALQTSDVGKEIFGRPVELYVEEGWRSNAVQRDLYEHVFPRMIRKQYPSFTEAEVFARRDELIARPSDDDSPSPHATGAAIDVRLRYAQPDLGYVPGAFVPMRRKSADMGQVAGPDYFEHKQKLSPKEQEYARNRRVFYWIMRGGLLGDDSGLVVNPTEYWHWSYGDQLWASLMQASYALFGPYNER